MKQQLIVALGLLAVGSVTGCSSTGADGLLAGEDPDRMVCKKMTKTGTRLKERVCKTATEWDRIAHENKQAKRNVGQGELGSVGSVGETGGRQ